MDIEKISNLIKIKRKEKGLTQEELASRINVTEKAISRWETGRGTPDISLLVPLSEELGVSVSEILKGREDKKDDKNIKDIIEYIDNSKKLKNSYVITIAFVIYMIVLLLYLLYLKVDYNDHYSVTYLGELVYNSFFITSIFLTNRFIANNYYDTKEDREKINKISFIMIFIVYLIMLFNLTIFSRFLNGYTYNLIPFKTILGYWAFPDIHNILVNIVGNIIIVMPLQFLLIKIFNINNYSKCLLIDIILVLSIETIQLISHTGVFDVDDMILNLIGMSIMYFLTTGKHKLLIKYKTFILTSIVSLIVTFLISENMSWYNFGDIPTRVVIIRLLFAYAVVEAIVYIAYYLFKKKAR